MNKKQKHWLREGISLLGMLAVVFAIRSSLFEPFKIPSGSMIPTLFIGDYIFVSKFTYGWHLPFSEWLGNKVMLTEGSPVGRGDVVVFLYPLDESVNYIKRVVGLPGDSLELRDSVLFINEKPMPLNRVPQALAEKTFKDLDDARFTADSIDMFEEEIEGKKHFVFYVKRATGHDFGPYIVPEGSFFAMGDDRDYSKDSRFWGPAPLKNIKGKARFIWFSLWLGSPEQEKWKIHPLRVGDAVL
ncbi:MAG: signal peptidase I [Bdellovibrionales bacterium GWB1_55_8]|nr:MAG: signal peptidase I [Bdellovibrionales bacterium GWB1_55_8]